MVALVIAVLILSVPANYPCASAATTIQGNVSDLATGKPIKDAAILVWRFERYNVQTGSKSVPYTDKSTFTTVARATTDSGGDYLISVDMPSVQNSKVSYVYYVCVHYDDSSSVGLDYLPQIFSIGATSRSGLNFKLSPAASIIFDGALLFADSPQQAQTFNYTVRSNYGSGAYDVKTFGTSDDAYIGFMGLSPNNVVVPVNTSFSIELKAVGGSFHSVTIGGGSLPALRQGEAAHVDVGQFLTPYNLNLTSQLTQTVQAQVNEVEKTGFYLQAEKLDMQRASALVSSAEEKAQARRYAAANADLREAYVKAAYIDGELRLMRADASSSTVFLTVFLGFTSAALALLLFESRRGKLAGTGVFLALVFSMFFLVYAGCKLVGAQFLMLVVGVSLLAALAVVFVLPRLFNATTVSVFSMAKHGLRARKARFLLTLTTVTVLVMGFVAFTSFSTDYGYMQTTVGGSSPLMSGLQVRQPLPNVPLLSPSTQVLPTFGKFEINDVNWLASRPEIVSVAPKVENYPTQRSFASLSKVGRTLNVFAAIGVSPSAEAKATHLDTLVVDGRYLDDTENTSILLSVAAAGSLNAKVGDRLTLKTAAVTLTVTLVGLLSDDGLSKMQDLDGAPIVPSKIVVEVLDPGPPPQEFAKLKQCDPSEVLVINWQTALRLSYSDFYQPDMGFPPPVFVSRADVLLNQSADVVSTAREMSLEKDFWVWAASSGVISLFRTTQYLELSGFSIVIPWLIVVLSVVIAMVNAIYERRREVAILSSVGLNPTHVTQLFTGEALITGVVGGGAGYLLGLCFYSAMSFFSINLVVRQKISAVWSLASMGISVTAVLVGAYVALRLSTVITPSLLRNWRANELSSEGNWIFHIPARVAEEGAEPLLCFMTDRLQSFKTAATGNVYDLWFDRVQRTERETPEAVDRGVAFSAYRREPNVNFVSRSEIILTKQRGDAYYSVKLVCKADQEKSHLTAAFIRPLFLEWSIRK